MIKESLNIENTKITICKNHQGGSIIYYLTSNHSGNEEEYEKSLETITKQIKKLTGKTPWTLAIINVNDWNNDLSPWEMTTDNEHFPGGGKHMLEKIIHKIIPTVEKDENYDNRCIVGYSLAGLFSLWAMYETADKNIFNCAASASGSLWFDNWCEYLSQRKAPKGSKIYLSLGIKEEKTKHPYMSKVGDATRKTYELIKEDTNVSSTELTMNNGGHFTEVELRVAKAMAWLV